MALLPCAFCRASDDKPTATVAPDTVASGTAAIVFSKQILPILQKNCLACHSASQAEGELVLESAEGITRGGASGPILLPGQGGMSPLFRLTSGLDDPAMPPADNRVGAKPLTADEQALIKRWIDEGAPIDGFPAEQPIHWQAVSSDQVPVFATAMAGDGRYVATGRGTQLEIFHVPTRQVVARPVDPLVSQRWQLPAASDVDVLQSMDFSPDGQWLATGAFRTIKLWKRTPVQENWPVDQAPIGARVWPGLPGGETALLTWPDGRMEIVHLATGQRTAQIASSGGETLAVVVSLTGWWTWNANHQLTLRHANTLATVAEVTLAQTHVSALAAQSLDGHEHGIAGTSEGTLLRWDLDTSQLSAEKPVTIPIAPPSDGHMGAVSVIHAVSPPIPAGDNARILRMTAGADGQVVARGAELQAVRSHKQPAPVSDIVLVRGSNVLIVGDAHGGLSWWNMTTGEKIRQEDRSSLRSVELSAADRTVQISKQFLENAEADRKKAEERVKQEKAGIEQNAKDFDEASKKVDSGRTNKSDMEAALAKASSDLQAAENVLNTLKAELDKLKVAVESAPEEEKEAKRKELANLESQAPAAEKTLTDARTAKGNADKSLMDAVTALEAAEKQKVSAMNAAERNQQNLARAETDLMQQTQLTQQRDASLKAAEASAKTLQESVPHDRDAVVGLAARESDLGLLVVLRNDGQLETRGLTTGELWETHSSPFRRGPILVAGAASTAPATVHVSRWIVGSAPDTCVSRQATLPDWRLVRTIGDPDDRYTLVDRVLALDFSPDGRRLASGGGDPSRSGELKIWNVEDGSLARSIPDAHSDTIFGVRFSPDGRTVLSGAADRFARTFDVETGNLLRAFEGHTNYVQAIGWRADGRMLATAGADKAVKFWDPSTGEQISTLNEAKKEVTGLSFLGLENRIALAAGDGQVLAVLTNGQEKKGMTGAASFLHALDSSSDGQWIVAAGADRVVRLWGKDGALVAEFKPTADNKP